MFHTPAKKQTEPIRPTTPPKTINMGTITKARTNVRRSIGEWETGRVLFPDESPAIEVQPSTLQEAKAWVTKAKIALNASRNLKSDIKASVTQAIDGLYRLIKNLEAGRPAGPSSPGPCTAGVGELTGVPQGRDRKGETESPCEQVAGGTQAVSQLLSSLEEHTKLMRESNERAKELQEALEAKKETLEAITYASVAASAKGQKRPVATALHSVVIASRNEMDTGDEILGKIRAAVNAKEGDIQIDRVRKGKDRKVVISCRSEEARSRVQKKIEVADKQLEVLVVKNQDPLVILRDVLSCHKDEDVLDFIKQQNKRLFRDLPAGDDRIEIRYRKKARNELLCHIVARVSPTLWSRLLGASEVYLDLQHIRVEDQSPLVQCSMCLGYGHSRRLCAETTEKCGYCGGPHQRKDCAEKLANANPTCCNCVKAKLEMTGHNAFSIDCPVRRRWEALARAKIAYC